MQLISAKRCRQGATVLAIGVALLVITLAGSAQSLPSIRNTWKAQYPGSTTDDNVLAGTGSECQICHQSSGGGNGWNPYGWRIRQGIYDSGLPAADAIIAAEVFDSDLDPTGASNLTEIDGGTQPGWTPGAANTIFFRDGTTLDGQSPPTISGNLDPPVAPVPIAGLWGRLLLVTALSLLSLFALRLQTVRPRT